MARCEVCGAEMESGECSPCHGTGDDNDKNNGTGGSCDYCDGTGEIDMCPNEGDDQHEAAFQETMKRVIRDYVREGE